MRSDKRPVVGVIDRDWDLTPTPLEKLRAKLPAEMVNEYGVATGHELGIFGGEITLHYDNWHEAKVMDARRHAKIESTHTYIMPPSQLLARWVPTTEVSHVPSLR